ncbi:sel1 repeat family protein [Leptospira perolatii]|nr:sel1 repeat family protein [Leptospira perolatii]
MQKGDLNSLRLAAEQGHALAQYYLGLHFLEGVGVEQSDAEAVKWLREAYLSGKPPAWSKAREALKFTEPTKEYRCPKCLSTNVEVGYAYMFKYECKDCGKWIIAPSSMDAEACEWDNPGYQRDVTG